MKRNFIIPAGNTGTTDRLTSLDAGFLPCSAAILAHCSVIKRLSNHFFTLFLTRFFIPLLQQVQLFTNLDLKPPWYGLIPTGFFYSIW